MSIKAVFFDIDGTIVPFGEHSIPTQTRLAIDAMRANGTKAFIATGRHFSWINNLGDAEFDGYVTTNGAQCLMSDGTTEIFRREIDRSDIKRLVGYIESHDISFMIAPAAGGLFVTSKNDDFHKASKLLNIPDVPVKPVQEALNVPVVMMMAFASQETLGQSKLFENVLTNCDPTRWCPYFADIVPKGNSKSIGIDMMIRHFGIDLNETMAFGDGANDISMLHHAAIGVALGNAPDEVKAAADYITTDITDNGIENALRHFNLI